MIKLKLGEQYFNVPTSWKDITYSKFCKIISFEDELNTNEFIYIVSDIPCNTLENIDVQSIDNIKTLISFVEDYSFLEKYNVIEEDLTSFEISKQSWYKLEKSKQAIKKHKRFASASAEIIKIYLGEIIDEKKINEVWGKINFFNNQIQKFFEKYKRLSEYEEDEFEFMANVKRFEQFGFFCQCVELSRKMGCSYDEVLNMSASQIYQTFLYDYEKSDYEKTLLRLKNKQA